jgi:hypothetical protein
MEDWKGGRLEGWKFNICVSIRKEPRPLNHEAPEEHEGIFGARRRSKGFTDSPSVFA